VDLEIVQLDLFDASDNLEQVIPVAGVEVKKAVIIRFDPVHEQQVPSYRQEAAAKEDQQDLRVIHGDDEDHHGQVYQGKESVEYVLGKEGLYPFMIVYPLHDIPCPFGFEEDQGQLHQFYEEVGDDGNVDTGADVQEEVAPEEVDDGIAHEEGELEEEDEDDEVYLFVSYSVIDHALREEGEDEG